MSWTSFNDGTGYVYQDVTIANGGSLSAAVDMGRNELVRIDLPSAWTAAALTFQVSVDGTTFTNLYISGSEFSKTEAAASRGVGIDYSDAVKMHRYIKVRSGTAASAVNQEAARTLRLVALQLG